MVKNILLGAFLGAFCLNATAQTAACKPDYQVRREQCKARASTTEKVESQNIELLVNEGACSRDPSRLDQECRDAIAPNSAKRGELQTRFPFADLNSITYTGTRQQDREVTDRCNWRGLKSDQVFKLYCRYSVPSPKVEYYGDNTCPIDDVVDENKCFSKSEVQIDSESVANCINLKPDTEENTWKKAFCITDLYDADNNLKISLPKEQQDTIANLYGRIYRGSSFQPALRKYAAKPRAASQPAK